MALKNANQDHKTYPPTPTLHVNVERTEDITLNSLLLNCDIGGSFGAWKMGQDAEVMPFIDCANIACGFHASDSSTMAKTVARLAQCLPGETLQLVPSQQTSAQQRHRQLLAQWQ